MKVMIKLTRRSREEIETALAWLKKLDAANSGIVLEAEITQDKFSQSWDPDFGTREK